MKSLIPEVQSLLRIVKAEIEGLENQLKEASTADEITFIKSRINNRLEEIKELQAKERELQAVENILTVDDLKDAMRQAIIENKVNDSFGDLHRHKLLLEGEKLAKSFGLKLNGTQLNNITTALVLEHYGKGRK